MTVRELLAALRAADRNAEVRIMENNSTRDDSVVAVWNGDDVVLIEFDTGKGFCPECSRGCDS